MSAVDVTISIDGTEYKFHFDNVDLSQQTFTLPIEIPGRSASRPIGLDLAAGPACRRFGAQRGSFVSVDREREPMRIDAKFSTYYKIDEIRRDRAEDLNMYREICLHLDDWLRWAMHGDITNNEEIISFIAQQDAQFRHCLLRFISKMTDLDYERFISYMQLPVIGANATQAATVNAIRDILIGIREGKLSRVHSLFLPPDCVCGACGFSVLPDP